MVKIRLIVEKTIQKNKEVSFRTITHIRALLRTYKKLGTLHENSRSAWPLRKDDKLDRIMFLVFICAT